MLEDPELKQDTAHAIELTRAGRHREAANSLEALVQRHPDAAPLLWYLGGIFLDELKEPKRALDYFRRASALCPQSERASLGVFHSLWDLGRQDQALQESTASRV